MVDHYEDFDGHCTPQDMRIIGLDLIRLCLLWYHHRMDCSLRSPQMSSIIVQFDSETH